MKKIDNHKFYKEAYEKHGISAKGLKWTSKHRQYIRFDVLSDFLKDDLENSTLCDVGCGYADLLEYFDINNIFPKEYLGLDCEEFMCEISSYRFQNRSFLQKDILKDDLPSYDYYFCSGALNILNKNEFFEAIKNCFDASKKGFVFNFLTGKPIHESTHIDVLTFCTKLTKDITIKDNYLDNDFSVFLKK